MTGGGKLYRLGTRHVGERYVLGAIAPKDNPNCKGPWDCAEFASWLVYQVSARLYGCRGGDPATADAYTGFWADDVERVGRKITVSEAAGIRGAAVLRVAKAGAMGHIVISDGEGGTVEAHSTKRGVVEGMLAGRRWDYGVLVPWIEYEVADPIPVPSADVLRFTDPPTTGTHVKTLQRTLKAKGFNPGPIDGVFGPWTHAAVVSFQAAHGLVVDGEVGAETLRAMT